MPIDAASESLRVACWHCTSYAGIAPGGNSARCMFRGQPNIQSPLGGCAYFSRVPGADDNLAPPAEFNTGGLSEVWRGMLLAVIAREA